MNFFKPVALLLAVLTLLDATPQKDVASTTEPAGGKIEGRIFFKGIPPEPEKIRVTKDAQICGSSQMSEEFIVSPENKGLRNAVVMVLGAGENPETITLNVEQTGCVYVPHVQVATVGSTLAVTNNDPTLHNVHATIVRDDNSKRTAFNVAQPAAKDPAKPSSIQKVLRRQGVYWIECDVHPWMRSYVVVHDNNYYGRSDESGYFTISDIPPGTYTVRIWHEGLGVVEKTVTVTEGQSATLDLPIEANE